LRQCYRNMTIPPDLRINERSTTDLCMRPIQVSDGPRPAARQDIERLIAALRRLEGQSVDDLVRIVGIGLHAHSQITGECTHRCVIGQID
jgi:hypothetical protein